MRPIRAAFITIRVLSLNTLNYSQLSTGHNTAFCRFLHSLGVIPHTFFLSIYSMRRQLKTR